MMSNLEKVMKYKMLQKQLKAIEEKALLNKLDEDEANRISMKRLVILKKMNKLYIEITTENQLSDKQALPLVVMAETEDVCETVKVTPDYDQSELI